MTVKPTSALTKTFLLRLRHHVHKKTISIHSTKAVSDIIGTILLLSISLALFTAVYIGVTTIAQNYAQTPTPTVNIIGSVSGNAIILMHNGGLALDADNTLIQYNIPALGIQTTYPVTSIPGSPASWTIGEAVSSLESGLLVGHGDVSLANFEVGVVVTDKRSNSVIMSGVIQEGESGGSPWVYTGGADLVGSFSARVRMTYSFVDKCGDTPKVNIRYRQIGQSTWQNDTVADWRDANDPAVGCPMPKGGSFSENYTGLNQNTTYEYQARIQYGTETITDPMLREFTTLSSLVGEWLFNNTVGNITFDTGPKRIYDGFLMPSSVLGPQKIVLSASDGALMFDGIDDTVIVSNFSNVDITNAITIEGQVQPAGYSNESVAVAQTYNLSDFFLRAYQCIDPDMINVSSDGEYTIYAVVSRSIVASSGLMAGYVVTLKVKNDGSIYNTSNTCVIDIFCFEANKCLKPKIIALPVPTNFAIVYTGSNDYGYIRTVRIDDDGNITDNFIATRLFAYSTCIQPDIVKVGTINSTHTMYAVVYTGPSSFGRICTLNISNDGTNITSGAPFTGFQSVKDSFSDCTMIEPEIIELSGGTNTFVIVFQTASSDDDDGALRTISIDPLTGVVTSLSYRVKFDLAICRSPEIIHVAGTYYAIVYGGPHPLYGDKIAGILITVPIPSDGILIDEDITSDIIAFNCFESNSDRFFNPRIIEIFADATVVRYAIVYKGGILPSSDFLPLVLTTISIDPNDGSIGGVIDWVVFAPLGSNNLGSTPAILPVKDNVFLLCYAKGDPVKKNDGVVKTITIAPDGTIDDNSPIIDAQELGNPDVGAPDILRISDTIYAVAFTSLDQSGYIKTIQISDGIVNNTIQGSYLIEKGCYSYRTSSSAQYNQWCLWPLLHKIKGNNYVVFYDNASGIGVKTIAIDPYSGVITPIKSASFSPRHVFFNGGIKINEDASGNSVFAITGRNVNDVKSYIKTIYISADGMNIQERATFNIHNATESSAITCVSRTGTSGVYAIVFGIFSGSNSGIFLTTLSISNDGITITPITASTESFMVESSAFCSTNYRLIIQPISQDGDSFADAGAYVIVYKGGITGLNIGSLKTVKITDAGVIQGRIDSFVFETGDMKWPRFIYIDHRTYAVMNYVEIAGGGSTGSIKMLRISQEGHISEIVDNTYSIGNICYELGVTNITKDALGRNRYAIVFGGGTLFVGIDFLVKIITINEIVPFQAIIEKLGSYGIWANGTTVRATIFYNDTINITMNGTMLNNQLNLIKVTYTQTTGAMNLSINGVRVVPNSKFSQPRYIKTSSGITLKFGIYNGIYNDFRIYGEARD
ncbi:MAG: type IV pilin [Euryarchaeota archaeon]|nr:type IV pilin [Euryarchaeota archaeon]